MFRWRNVELFRYPSRKLHIKSHNMNFSHMYGHISTLYTLKNTFTRAPNIPKPPPTAPFVATHTRNCLIFINFFFFFSKIFRWHWLVIIVHDPAEWRLFFWCWLLAVVAGCVCSGLCSARYPFTVVWILLLAASRSFRRRRSVHSRYNAPSWCFGCLDVR